MPEQTVTYRYVRPTITSTFHKELVAFATLFGICVIVIFYVSTIIYDNLLIQLMALALVFSVIFFITLLVRKYIKERQLIKDLHTAILKLQGSKNVTVSKPDKKDDLFQYDATFVGGSSEHGRLVEHPGGVYVLVNLGPQSAGF